MIDQDYANVRREYMRQWYQEHKEEQKALARERYRRNKEIYGQRKKEREATQVNETKDVRAKKYIYVDGLLYKLVSRKV